METHHDPNKRYSHYATALSEPPEYNSAIRFDGSRAGSFAVRDHQMPYLDSNRAIANGEQDNGAGIGAGRNAYMAPDTPSMYTDPFEYTSNVGTRPAKGIANVTATRPDPNFLNYDPQDLTYEAQGTQPDLQRNNTIGTLGPNDSVSAYNIPARSRHLNSTENQYSNVYPLGNQSYETDHYYHDAGYSADHGTYDASAPNLPLKDHAAYMGYADDEEDEKRQRDQYWSDKDAWDRQHPPSLFANNMQGPPVPQKSIDYPEEDRRGLLNTLTGRGSKAGWGGTVEDQIERRKKGMGRQRWPILSWILG